MDCRDIRETMSACVDGEASPEEAARIREHLSSCEACRVLERQMRAVGDGVRQVRRTVPDGFRNAVFARLDAEGALPARKRGFSPSWRWAAVPLAAAAGLGLFLLASREAVRTPVPQGPVTSQVEAPVPGPSAPVPSVRPPVPPAPAQETDAVLSTEDREMLALLDILEDPAALEANVDPEEMDLLAPGDSTDTGNPPRRGRSGA